VVVVVVAGRRLLKRREGEETADVINPRAAAAAAPRARVVVVGNALLRLVSNANLEDVEQRLIQHRYACVVSCRVVSCRERERERET
jgi:hypothetical protein